MIKNVKSAAQAGFTLIELVVVIVILGILAATALPKVTSMGAEARVGVMNAVAGAATSAAQIEHARLLATGATVTYPTVAQIGALVDLPDGVTAASDGTFTHTKGKTPANCKVAYDASSGTASVSDSSGC